MKSMYILIALLSVGLTGCQTIPAERKNNCACMWETMDGQLVGEIA